MKERMFLFTGLFGAKLLDQSGIIWPIFFKTFLEFFCHNPGLGRPVAVFAMARARERGRPYSRKFNQGRRRGAGRGLDEGGRRREAVGRYGK